MAAQDVILLDDEEQKHAQEIARNVAAATGDSVQIAQLVPAFNQHPLPQFAQTQAQSVQSDDQAEEDNQVAKPESEVIDVLKGWSGKPRTAPAKDFLASKMKWLSKKNKGSEVSLK